MKRIYPLISFVCALFASDLAAQANGTIRLQQRVAGRWEWIDLVPTPGTVISFNSSLQPIITTPSGGGGGGTWGSITGTLGDQGDLSTALAGKQPINANLTSIAALTTTAFGRSFLTLADAAAGRTYLALGTAATFDVPTSGNASSTQLVKGNDTRLSDARAPAALDVVAHGNAGSAVTLTYSDLYVAGSPGTGPEHSLTLNSASCTITLAGFPASKRGFLTVKITQDATGGRPATYSPALAGGGTPTLDTSANAVTWVQFWSEDGGTTIYYASTATTGGSSPEIASQAEAEAGTNNTKMMTPLRTAQAIAELAPSGGGGAYETGDVKFILDSASVPSGWSLTGVNGIPAFTTPDADYKAVMKVAGTVATPTFSPAAGAVASGSTITFLSATSGVTFRHTFGDGTQAAPTRSSGTTGSSAVISGAGTYKVIAYRDDVPYIDSAVATAAYTISGGGGGGVTLPAQLSVDFASTQNSNGWEFGRLTTEGDASTFTTSGLSYNGGTSRWETAGSGDVDGSPYLAAYPAQSHPGYTTLNGQSAAARWTSASTATVNLSVAWALGSSSGNVFINVYKNGVLQGAGINVATTTPGTLDYTSVSIVPGDEIVIELNRNASPFNDGCAIDLTIATP